MSGAWLTLRSTRSGRRFAAARRAWSPIATPPMSTAPGVPSERRPRAVVTTASYEARRYGIFSATPAERARRLCPEAVFIPPDFALYRARSKEVMVVLREHVDRVEVVGLDEAYLDLTAFDRPRAAARRVKAA